MLKEDRHKRALEHLDKLIDLSHVHYCEQLQQDAWEGREPERLPCILSFPTPSEWPEYSFSECWDDIEKNFMTGLGGVYCGAVLKDDRLFTLTPDCGCITIPELFGVRSSVSDLGRSMSEGLHDIDAVRALIDRGIPDFRRGRGAWVAEFYDFATRTLAQYENLSATVHLIMPDTQGPFDLAHLIWGSDMYYALFDNPQVMHQLLELMTETYIRFSILCKELTGEPLLSGYHVCGLKLVRGGVRTCDDSAIICSRDVYLEFVKPYNIKAFKPFEGGWLHFCGNGTHVLDEMLTTPEVNAIHMGNPDNWDLIDIFTRMRAANIVLIWSGSMDRLKELRVGGAHPTGLIILTENRYASADLAQAKMDLQSIRNYRPIAKSPY